MHDCSKLERVAIWLSTCRLGQFAYVALAAVAILALPLLFPQFGHMVRTVGLSVLGLVGGGLLGLVWYHPSLKYWQYQYRWLGGIYLALCIWDFVRKQPNRELSTDYLLSIVCIYAGFFIMRALGRKRCE